METTQTSIIPFFVGQKIGFEGESKRYTVRACSDRFAICTKPFNAKRTVLYTIIDLEKNIRGTENLIFCMGFQSDEECQEALVRLISEETEVSHRNHVELEITSQSTPI